VLTLLFVVVLQTASQPPPPSIARGDRFQLVVPQGWKALNESGSVLLAHASGASLLIQRINRTSNLADYAQRQADRIMMPLGFADKLEEPRLFKADNQEWVQYEIRGNRLSERRRLLYRAQRKDANYFEFVYEAAEDQFDSLLTEAQAIASSVEALIQAPPPRRTRR
jgi:hypothetical protein